jgi:hypothetical protein
MNVVTRSDRVARTAAVLAAIGFAGLATFQAALAAGAPWGHAAWGGEEAHLSAAQRGASAVAAVVYVAATLIVLGRAGIWRAHPNAIVFRWGTWLLAVVMLLGAVPNFASQNRWENVIFGPLALVLAGLCGLVARHAAAGPAHGNASAAEP